MRTERTIPSTRPTDLPTFSVSSDGEKIPDKFHIFSFTVSKSINRISFAELVLKDGDPATEDFPLSNTDLFKPGAKIEIEAGYHNDNLLIFSGIVIKHSIKARDGKPSMLVLECKDAAVKMTGGRKNRYYSGMSDSEIFEEIIDGYDLESELESTTQTHEEMVQYYATDWDFLLARAEMNSQYVLPDDGKLIIKKPAIGEADLVLTYGATIMEMEAEIDARDQQHAVKTSSWDYAAQELVDAEGSEPELDQGGNISADELADVINLEELSMKHSGQVLDTELQAWSDAALLKSRMAKIRGRVRSKGYPKIKPFDTVELKGVGERFNGKVFVSGVRHHYSTERWITDIEFGLSPKWFYKEDDINEKSAAGLLPGVNGLQIGIVTQLQDDPEGEDRVLVKLPVVDNQEEGIWTRVSTLDAGADRGSFFRPEIGDEVLVGFINDDPRDPVILGMMNSSAKPAPAQASDDNHEKGFVTREELRLWFNDDEKSITVETPNGNSIILSDDDGSIKLEDENGNTLFMNTDGITLESTADITMKASGDVKIEGINIEQKANAQFKAEGTAGAEVSSSGTSVLKGAIVQIN